MIQPIEIGVKMKKLVAASILLVGATLKMQHLVGEERYAKKNGYIEEKRRDSVKAL